MTTLTDTIKHEPISTSGLTTKRESPGHFKVFWNGVDTNYEIINDDLGCSGRAANVYGIIGAEIKVVKWIGTLQACKKILAFTFQNRK